MIDLEKASENQRAKLSEVALAFGKIGATAFGGPAAHIAVMEEDLIRRRRWLSRDQFLDLLSATNLIPGPNSTELAAHIGHKVAGWKGLVVAGVAFITPAFLAVWAIAWSYVEYGSLPAAQAIFHGLQPVILAVIGQAIWSLSQTAIKDRLLGFFAALSLGLYLTTGHEILVLFLIAGLNLAFRTRLSSYQSPLVSLGLVGALILHPFNRAWSQGEPLVKPLTDQLFYYFVKVGSVLFGSGYVLFAFLQNDLATTLRWISPQQVIDAIAVGQFTPGPVFTTATFVGYLVSGHEGALVATVGIFAPAFILVAITAPVIPRLRRFRWAGPLLDGLNVASLSVMAGGGLFLTKSTVNSAYGAIAFVLSLVLLLKFKINSAWLVLTGGLFGFFGWTA